jgi:hypothetical protein
MSDPGTTTPEGIRTITIDMPELKSLSPIGLYQKANALVGINKKPREGELLGNFSGNDVCDPNLTTCTKFNYNCDNDNLLTYDECAKCVMGKAKAAGEPIDTRYNIVYGGEVIRDEASTVDICRAIDLEYVPTLGGNFEFNPTIDGAFWTTTSINETLNNKFSNAFYKSQCLTHYKSNNCRPDKLTGFKQNYCVAMLDESLIGETCRAWFNNLSQSKKKDVAKAHCTINNFQPECNCFNGFQICDNSGIIGGEKDKNKKENNISVTLIITIVSVVLMLIIASFIIYKVRNRKNTVKA